MDYEVSGWAMMWESMIDRIVRPVLDAIIPHPYACWTRPPLADVMEASEERILKEYSGNPDAMEM